MYRALSRLHLFVKRENGCGHLLPCCLFTLASSHNHMAILAVVGAGLFKTVLSYQSRILAFPVVERGNSQGGKKNLVFPYF